jgi:spore coat protein H
MRKAVISLMAALTLAAGCGGGGGGGGGSAPELPALTFTELLANSSVGDTWLEIRNRESFSVSLVGIVLETDSGEAVFLTGDLAPGEIRAIAVDLDSGPDRASLSDSSGRLIVEVSWPALSADDPDPLRDRSLGLTANGAWQFLPVATPGAENAEPAFTLVLNEACADNETSLENPDDPGEYDDWIEIVNVGPDAVDAGGFGVTDDLGDPMAWTIPAGTVVPAGGHLIIHADDETDDLGGLHAPFKLSKGGEEIGLFAPDGTLVDAFVYEIMGSDRSRGRARDGAPGWVSFRGGTPGGPNHTGLLDATDDPAHREDDPNLDFVYDESVVRRLDIRMTSDRFSRMQNDLTEQLARPQDERDFIYVEGEVEFAGEVWRHVGVRYKGSSSVEFPHELGQRKLPLKLDFDEFEEIYPAFYNQKFWGLKKLSLSNGFQDPTLLRELLCLRLMREAGAHVSRGAPLAVWFDNGTGPTYWGLYTAAEQIDDVFLEDRFGDESGNLYKPEGEGADLTRFVEASFEKKTNEDEADFDDVKNLIEVLNAAYPDTAAQKAAIEAVLEVDTLLPWLAVNSAICNFDSYATNNQNYYLYFHHDDGRARFITWDHNLAFGSPVALFTAQNAHRWSILDPFEGERPLIERVLEIPEWRAEYERQVLALLDGPLSEAVMDERIDTLHNLLRPHVFGGERPPFTLLGDPSEFLRGLTEVISAGAGKDVPGLLTFLTARRAFINSALR